MELFRILLCFRDGKNLQFCFKSEAPALAVYRALNQAEPQIAVPSAAHAPVFMPNRVEIADDYGNRGTINTPDLTAVIVTNVNEDLHSQTDLQIIQAHNEVWREKKMENDPIIREAMKRMQARAALAGMNGQPM